MNIRDIKVGDLVYVHWPNGVYWTGIITYNNYQTEVRLRHKSACVTVTAPDVIALHERYPTRFTPSDFCVYIMHGQMIIHRDHIVKKLN